MSPLFFACILGALFCAACESAPAPASPLTENETSPPPRARLSPRPPEASDGKIDRLSLTFVLEAENPRPSSCRLNLEAFSLSLNGQKAGEAARELVSPAELGSVPPLAAGTFPLVLELDLKKLESPERPLNLEALLELDLVFDYDSGPEQIRVSGKTAFPLIREPVFRISSVMIKQADLINTSLELQIRIENPNPFPASLSSLTYTLYGEGRFWAQGEEKNVLTVPGFSVLETGLSLTMNFIDMKRSLLDQVIAARRVNYRFSGEALVATGIEYLLRFRSGFDLSGVSEVKE